MAIKRLTTAPDVVVPTKGTAVQGPDQVVMRDVWVVANSKNSGSMYVGGSEVTNGSGTKRGVELIAGGMVKIEGLENTNELYFNADENNDKVGLLVR